MRIDRSLPVVATAAVLLQACASRPSPMVVTALALPSACDTSCYKADRQKFLTQLKARRDQNDGKGAPNQKKFYAWSAASIIVGLTGALLGFTLPSKNDRKNFATGASLSTAAIATWIAIHKYAAQAAKYKACVTAADAGIETFKATWSDAYLPTTTSDKKAYRDMKEQIVKQLNEVCPE